MVLTIDLRHLIEDVGINLGFGCFILELDSGEVFVVNFVEHALFDSKIVVFTRPKFVVASFISVLAIGIAKINKRYQCPKMHIDSGTHSDRVFGADEWSCMQLFNDWLIKHCFSFQGKLNSNEVVTGLVGSYFANKAVYWLSIVMDG